MFEYELPDVGEGVAEGEIVAWHVEPGDNVTEDEVLAEVETDKAVVDLPSPVDGVVVELHAQPGDIVPVGSVVITIDNEGNNQPEEADEPSEPTEGDERQLDSGADSTETTETATETRSADSTPASDQVPAREATDDESQPANAFAPPRVRRLARELGVDIASVAGSGQSGRITEADVRTIAEAEPPAADQQGREEADTGGSPEPDSSRKPAITRRDESAEGDTTAEATATGDGAPSATPSRDRTLAAPATRALADDLDVDIDAVPTDTTRDGEPFVEPADVRAFADGREAESRTASGEDTSTERIGTREPYRGVRRTIGQRMSTSAFTAPHATHHDTAVVPSLVEARDELQQHAADRGVTLTYLPFVMKALAATLPEYPPLNAELDEEAEEIVYHDRYDIGIAVATDAGLMVPVVERVGDRGLVDLAVTVEDLVERAQSRDLAPEELQGSTFTITNFGAIGGEYATPILNYPETGILGLGRIDQRPVVEDGDVVARHTLPLSLSIDHRVVDGADAARFCNELITHLENPIRLLL